LASLALAAVVALPTTTATAGTGPAVPAAAAGSIGLRLLDVPDTAGNDPRARIYIVDHLAPGTVIHRRIEVSNTTVSTAHIVMYAAAATVASGSFSSAAGHTPNDLSTWTSVHPGTSDVPTDGVVTATVTITVPREAASGKRYGVVWAETRSAPIVGGGMIQVSRVGIRIYLSVGPGAAPAANFTIDRLTANRSPDGRPMVQALVHNTGGRALDMSGTLQLLAGPGGLSAGPFPATVGATLAISATEPVTIALDKRIPAGPWGARITLHSGLIERSARATITFPPRSTRTGWLYPGIAGLAVGLLLGTATLLVALRRRRPGHR